LAAIVQSSDDAIIGKTLEGQITSWNAAAERIYGYGAAQAVGNHVSMLVPPGDEDQFSELLARVAAGERVSHRESTRRGNDGRTIDVSAVVSPIRDRTGRVTGASTIARDITERKQAERELARLADAAEHGTDAVISIDLDARVCHWNRGAERLYGWSREEAVGKSLYELTVFTDEPRDAIERMLAGESAYQYETQRRRKDLTIIDVLLTISPWRVDGQVVGATGISIDLSERKARERESERLAAAAEHGTDAVISVDLDGRIRHWNPGAERLYGWSANEAVGRRLAELLIVLGDEHADSIARMLAGERAYTYETQRRRKDGTIIDVRITVSPWTEGQRVVGVTGIAIDVSEQKARQRELAGLEARWRAAARELPGAALIIFDERLQTVEADGEALREIGVDTGAALGQLAAVAIGADQGAQDQVAAAFQAAVSGERTEFEIEVDGRTLHSRAVGLDLGDGCRRGMSLSIDVTDQRHAEAELRRSEQRLRTIFEGAPIGVALVDAHVPFALLQANRALGEMLGVDPEQLVGRGVLTLIDRPQRAVAEGQLQRLLDGGQRCVAAEVQIREGRSDPLWVNVNTAVIGDADGRPEHLVLQLQDITERKRFEHELRIHAERDPLTGLLNRRRFNEELERAVAKNQRYGTPATLLIADLDSLKLVNDTLGHKAGDALIKSVAGVLADGVRRTDVLARMGGDEFAVLLPHTPVERAQAMAERLRAAVLDLDLVASGQMLRPTLSIGIAPICEGLSAEESLIAADLAMYDAKRHGRNRIATSRQAFGDDVVAEQLGWLERLRRALSEDRFELHAQPITELRSGRVRCMELLLRLREDDGELLMPAAFIPTAERFGLIAEIDRWVVRKAIGVLAEDRHGDTIYTINLSGVSIGDPELLRLIDAEITTAAVDPGRLVFEFTETAAINDLGASREFTHGLARIGCATALDDFGSGFAAFSYLKHLPVKYVKIDGQFVQDLPGSTDDRVLVKAIVDVARGLHKQTIAGSTPQTTPSACCATTASTTHKACTSACRNHSRRPRSTDRAWTATVNAQRVRHTRCRARSSP